MKANNQISAARPAAPVTSFTSYVNQNAIVAGLTKQVGGSAEKAARLIATMKRIVSKSPKLQNCDPASIVSSVLYGEIGLDLSEEFGEYSVVPYGTKAAFQIGAKGLQQLSIRSGKYSAIDCFDVRQGEYKGRDPRTRAPIFAWIEDDDVRDQLPIVGYYAFFMLNDDYNNYFQAIYWTHEKILRHAGKYSKAFNRKTYDMILNHELSDEEIAKKQSGSSWYALPNEEPHIKMCKKTMYKQLLSDGRAPKSIREAIAIDSAPEKDGETPILDAPNPISGALIDAAPVDSLPDASEIANFDAGEAIDVPVSNFTPEAEKPSTAKKTASPVQESFFND